MCSPHKCIKDEVFSSILRTHRAEDIGSRNMEILPVSYGIESARFVPSCSTRAGPFCHSPSFPLTSAVTDDISAPCERAIVHPPPEKFQEKPKGPSETEFSHLEALPAEIFATIINQISTFDRLCLALCSKGLLRTLGLNTKILGPESVPSDTRLSFIHQLIRGTPAWLCYRCYRAHKGRQMFHGLWHLPNKQVPGCEAKILGFSPGPCSSGLPYCDFDNYASIKDHRSMKIQHCASLIAPSKPPAEYDRGILRLQRPDVMLDTTLATMTVDAEYTLGHKLFCFRSFADRWSNRSTSFGPLGFDIGINIDFCQHLSLRQTQPDHNIIADAISCAWIMASHRFHGDGRCTNATCEGGYAVPVGHEDCIDPIHFGSCSMCPTEYVVTANPHWRAGEILLSIAVWHDLSASESSAAEALLY